MNLVLKLCTLLLTMMTYHVTPVQAAINCTALGGLEGCPRPRDSGNVTSGQFICRRRFDNAVGRVRSQTLCIAKTWGRPSDRCGCCNGNCLRVCDTTDTPYPLCPNPMQGAPGQLGVWMYDHFSRNPKRKCVTPGRSIQLQQQNSARWKCTLRRSWNIPPYNRNFEPDVP